MKRVNKYLIYIYLILCIGIWLFFVLKNTYYNKLLKEKGVCTKAKVIGVYKSSGKMTRSVKCEYIINNIIYVSKVSGPFSSEIGDFIDIVYLPNDPIINRPRDILDIDCNNHK